MAQCPPVPPPPIPGEPARRRSSQESSSFGLIPSGFQSHRLAQKLGWVQPWTHHSPTPLGLFPNPAPCSAQPQIELGGGGGLATWVGRTKASIPAGQRHSQLGITLVSAAESCLQPQVLSEKLLISTNPTSSLGGGGSHMPATLCVISENNCGLQQGPNQGTSGLDGSHCWILCTNQRAHLGKGSATSMPDVPSQRGA